MHIGQAAASQTHAGAARAACACAARAPALAGPPANPPWKLGAWQDRPSRAASSAEASKAGASGHSVGSSPDVTTGANALMVNAALQGWRCSSGEGQAVGWGLGL